MEGLRRRSRQSNSAAHIFQRAVSGFVVFYNVKDSLFFLTLSYVIAKRCDVRIIGLCLMHNHVHILLDTCDLRLIRRFVRELMSYFSKSYNRRYGMTRALFDEFGVSFKKGDKEIRSALAYVNNNPVEDHICHRAEEWRWNFLAYSASANPFSEKIVLSSSSRRMRRAVAKVRFLRSSGQPLTYEVLDGLFGDLSALEKRQLVDLIVCEYSVVDFESAISYYGSYEEMLTAFASNTGSEYDISEPFDPHSGQAYGKMASYLAKDHRFRSIGDVLRLPLNMLTEYLGELVSHCGVRQCHAMKFLHIRQDKCCGA